MRRALEHVFSSDSASTDFWSFAGFISDLTSPDDLDQGVAEKLLSKALAPTAPGQDETLSDLWVSDAFIAPAVAAISHFNMALLDPATQAPFTVVCVPAENALFRTSLSEIRLDEAADRELFATCVCAATLSFIRDPDQRSVALRYMSRVRAGTIVGCTFDQFEP